MINDVFQAKKRIFVSENKMLLETNCSRLDIRQKGSKIVDVTLGHICFKKLDSQFVENLFPADFFLFFNWNLPLLHWPGLFSQKIFYFCQKNVIYHFLKFDFWHILRHSFREYSRDLAEEKAEIEILAGKEIPKLFISLDSVILESRKLTKNASNLENLEIDAPSKWNISLIRS